MATCPKCGMAVRDLLSHVKEWRAVHEASFKAFYLAHGVEMTEDQPTWNERCSEVNTMFRRLTGTFNHLEYNAMSITDPRRIAYEEELRQDRGAHAHVIVVGGN